MAMNGKSTGEIAAYSAIVILPFSLKILLAPIMERYTYLPMGRRRPWLILGQIGILLSLLGLSLVPNPLENIALVTWVVLCVHVFIIFQDIATDSLVIDIVPLEEQGRANSLMWGSKTIGTSISLFVGSWLINEYGFANALLFMALPVFFIIFVPLFIRERKGEKLLPWGKGQTSPDAAKLAVDSWKKLFKSFVQVVILKNTLILLISVFIALASLHFMRTLLPIFAIQELGWDNVYYSKVYSLSNLAGGIIGMVIGAIIIQRFGIVRLIQGSMVLIALLGIAMALLTAFWTQDTFVSAYIAIFCTLFTLINIGVLALAMHLCWKRISAIQFTLCMTVFNLGLASGAALLGYLRSFFEWKMLFVAFAVIILLGLIILKFIKTKQHLLHVERLEKQYLEVLEAEGSLLVKSETT
jgi:PAT family beta-lactamase induction signal transducer AmpG